MKGKSIEYKGLPRATHEGNHFQGLGRFPWLLRLYVFKSFAHTVPEISVQPLSQEDEGRDYLILGQPLNV